jgi:hypothetical protein
VQAGRYRIKAPGSVPLHARCMVGPYAVALPASLRNNSCVDPNPLIVS